MLQSHIQFQRRDDAKWSESTNVRHGIQSEFRAQHFQCPFIRRNRWKINIVDGDVAHFSVLTVFIFLYVVSNHVARIRGNFHFVWIEYRVDEWEFDKLMIRCRRFEQIFSNFLKEKLCTQSTETKWWKIIINIYMERESENIQKRTHSNWLDFTNGDFSLCLENTQ